MSSSVCIHFASVQTFHFQLGLYPVDILDDDPEGHREAALAYYATLRGGAPPPAAALSLPAGEQVNLEAASVCLCTLHRDEPRHKILVLVSPQDTKTGSDIWGKDCAFPSQRRYLWKVGEKIGRRRHVLFASLCEGAGENSVARRSGGRVLHNEKERQPVRGWHGSLLPAARPRHCVCPEGTPAPGPGHGHAAGLLWNIPGRGGPGGQLADFSCHVPRPDSQTASRREGHLDVVTPRSVDAPRLVPGLLLLLEHGQGRWVVADVLPHLPFRANRTG
ncbi:uncharacterized protein WM277_009234 isoform 7-T7 [Molossus nigricans]